MRFLAFLALWVLSGASSLADTLRVLVDREPAGISVYFATDAENLADLFGASASGLLGADGTVDVEDLYRGTFDTADDVFAKVTARIDALPFTFEALSMMVHDPSVLPPFETPYDAAMSIAVCNSPETVRDMRLNELEAYLGFYAWKVDPRAEIVLTFPATGRDEFSVEVLDYLPTGSLHRSSEALADGGVLILRAHGNPRHSTLWPLVIAVSAIVLVGTAFGYVRHRRLDPEF